MTVTQTIEVQSSQLTQQANGGQSVTGSQEPSVQETQPSPAQSQPGVLPIIGLEDTNCREGPSPDYSRLGALLRDQESIIHSSNPSRTWWYIENPKTAAQYC